MPDCSWVAPFDALRLVRLLDCGERGGVFFYAYYFCDELIKTAPTDAMIPNRQLNQCPCLVSSLSPSVVSCGRGGCCLLCDISFPVVFVLFRLTPELSIFLGIIRLCCDFLLAFRVGDVIDSAFFLFITWLGSAARAVPALVMSSVSAVCLLALSGDVITIVIRFAFLRFAPRRLAPRPAHHVGGRGAVGAACLPRDVVARGVALAWP